MTEEQNLRKKLGYWSLTAAGLGSVIGSGWLFGAWKAAQLAGPESIIGWILGGIAMLLVGLVFAELGMVKPESGGLVRYPKYSNGSLVSSLIGLALWLGYVANPPTEAAGAVQYASKFHALSGLYSAQSGQLTATGILVSVAFMAVFVVINYFGVHLFGRVNTFITAIKLLVPTATIIALLVSGFHPSHFTASQYGGFSPHGWGAGLSAIATAGIIFAYTGFRNVVDLSGEATNPRRNVPLALLTTIVVGIVLYMLLEIVFIGATPNSALRHGWANVNFNSPFVDIAASLNMMWLYWMLMADAMISPAGSSFAYTAANARNVLGLAKNRLFPRYFAGVSKKHGAPTRGLILNFVVGLLFLVPLKSWYGIISITGALAVYTFCAGSISVMVFRKMGLSDGNTIKGMKVFAPLAFVVSTLIIYWDPWAKLRATAWILGVCLVIYLITYFVNKEKKLELIGGLWMIAYLVLVLFLSSIGDFGGAKLIPEPYMSIVVAIVSLIIYFIGVKSGVCYMRKKNNLSEVASKPASDVQSHGF